MGLKEYLVPTAGSDKELGIFRVPLPMEELWLLGLFPSRGEGRLLEKQLILVDTQLQH